MFHSESLMRRLEPLARGLMSDGSDDDATRLRLSWFRSLQESAGRAQFIELEVVPKNPYRTRSIFEVAFHFNDFMLQLFRLMKWSHIKYVHYLSLLFMSWNLSANAWRLFPEKSPAYSDFRAGFSTYRVEKCRVFAHNAKQDTSQTFPLWMRVQLPMCYPYILYFLILQNKNLWPSWECLVFIQTSCALSFAHASLSLTD